MFYNFEMNHVKPKIHVFAVISKTTLSTSALLLVYPQVVPFEEPKISSEHIKIALQRTKQENLIALNNSSLKPYLSIVELSVYINLSLGDIAGKIGSGMGNIWSINTSSSDEWDNESSKE